MNIKLFSFVFCAISTQFFLVAGDDNGLKQPDDTHSLTQYNIEYVRQEPIYIKITDHREPFPFAKHNNIFEQIWPKKSVNFFALEHSSSSFLLDDKFTDSQFEKFKQYITNPNNNLDNNYLLRYIAHVLVIPHIQTSKIDIVELVLNLCRKHKIHLWTALSIQGTQGKNGCQNNLRQALKNTKRKILDQMKINIATFIEDYGTGKTQQQNIINPIHIQQLVKIYQIAVYINNIHQEIFSFPESTDSYVITEEVVMQHFFPSIFGILKNISKNLSPTTKRN